MIPPINLAGMLKYTEFRSRLELECDGKKEEINLISNYVEVIGEICSIECLKFFLRSSL